MSHLPQRCPRCEFGTLEVKPSVETELETDIHGGTQYVTTVTIICDLVANCDSCDFVEIISHDTQYATFDQTFHVNEQPVELNPQFLQDVVEMHQFYEEGNYVE